MTPEKAIGFVFIDRFADWEYGFLSASAVEWFGARVTAMTPGGRSVISASGFEMKALRGLGPADADGLDALAVIGSDGWTARDVPDLSGLFEAVSGRGGVVGGICAGTLPMARAGLFDGRLHTSNGRVWIADHLATYRGQGHYRDVPHAVADGNIISAPGTAPASFALAFLGALYPGAAAQLEQMRALFAAEHVSREAQTEMHS
ncbi:glutamine amidotransferase [Nitratireductor mangrovi]|uniref:Glutamine amidotransferase n=1 Tax=Nitratireductor mangrovi TaxID=2599600 RepID=A0A5B8KWQ7_9HYPH|nr:DJ-1/PfpI family protein [Nitratireductor mangrovi]QDZ00011.1 glutamine amidotransferase [Nitratireductor mangrovi]